MRDSKLADGCSAQEYSHRIKMLQRWHIPHLQRPFPDDESLAKFLIELMPEKNGQEGRDLMRRLKADGELTSIKAVTEATRIVKQTESAAVRKAAANAVMMQSYGVPPALLANQGSSTHSLAAYSAAIAAINPPFNNFPNQGGAASLTSGASKKANAKAAAAAAAAAPDADAAAAAVAKAKQASLDKGRAAAAAAAASSGKDVYKRGGAVADNRLPEGQTCGEGTCPFKHEGKCWRAPWYAGPLPEPQCFSPKLVERLNAAKEANIKAGIGKANQLVRLSVKAGKPAQAAANPSAGAADDGGGVDSFAMCYSKPGCCALRVSTAEGGGVHHTSKKVMTLKFAKRSMRLNNFTRLNNCTTLWRWKMPLSPQTPSSPIMH